MLLSDLVNIWSWFKTLGQDFGSTPFCSVPLAVRKMRFRPTCSDCSMRSITWIHRALSLDQLERSALEELLYLQGPYRPWIRAIKSTNRIPCE